MADEVMPLRKRTPKSKTTTAKTTKKKPVVSEAIKNGATKKTTVELDGELFLKMKIRIAERDMKMKDYLESVIRADLEK